MKEALDQQMQDTHDRRALAAEEFLRENAEVDAVVAAIEKEEENEREAREAKEARKAAHISRTEAAGCHACVSCATHPKVVAPLVEEAVHAQGAVRSMQTRAGESCRIVLEA